MLPVVKSESCCGQQQLNLLTYKTCPFLILYRPPLRLLANIALIEKRPAQSEFSASSGSNMLQVVKSESGFGQRQQSSPNRQQQKRKGDNFGDEDPTGWIRCGFDCWLWSKALAKSVATAATPRRQVQALLSFFSSWFVVPEKSQPKTAARCLRRLRCRL